MPFSIGDFARLGGVSTRMLRHYDEIGLLAPERVDPATGYRWYGAAQLTRLNKLIALRELGFRLDAIAALLDADPDETRSRLERRRDELAASVDADLRRLAAVDARLHLVADAGAPDLAFVERALPALRIVDRTGSVDDAGELGTVVGPLFASLSADLAAHDVSVLRGPAYAWYGTVGDAMVFGVGFPAPDPVPPGFGTHDLPAVSRALTTVHHGPIDRIDRAWQAVAREAETRGATVEGIGREVYHETPVDRPEDWVTEVQLPIA